MASRRRRNIGSYPQNFGHEDSDSDSDYGIDDGYCSDSNSRHDDFTDPFRYDKDGNYRGDYSHRAEFLANPFRGYHDEAEGKDNSYTYMMAIPSKDEDEQAEKTMNIGVLSKIPSDIVFDILSRLPIRTLARCRCVCKDLCRITHICRFIKMHHSRAIQCDIPPSLLLHNRYCFDELCSAVYLLQHDICDDTLDGRDVVANPWFFLPNNGFEVVGSCNGLVCFSERMYYGRRFICNPVTGEYIWLPKPDKHTGFDIGFGYDEGADEYKVVKMLFQSIDLPSFKLEGKVYSLSLGKWRDIGAVPYPIHGSAAFVNGALHWTTDDYGALNVPELIVSFDLGREEFRGVPPPPGFVSANGMTLMVLGGCLCVFRYTEDRHLEIWVMKKYGVKGSWTKEYVISQNGLGGDSGHFIPLRLMENGELLLSYQDKCQCLVLYDSVTKIFRDIRIRGLPPRFDAITHAGSLLPLWNAIGLAKSESMIYGDKQPSEHGSNPD